MSMGGSGGSMGRQSFMPRFTPQSGGFQGQFGSGGYQSPMRQFSQPNPGAPQMTGGPSTMSFDGGQPSWGPIRPNTGIQLPQRPGQIQPFGSMQPQQPTWGRQMDTGGYGSQPVNPGPPQMGPGGGGNPQGYGAPVNPGPAQQGPGGGMNPQQPAGSGPGTQRPSSNIFMSEWGGTGNVFDPQIMAQNGWGFDPTTGAWNGAIPDEYRNTYRGDGFTGVRPGSGVLSIRGQDAVGAQYLGGSLDPRQAGWLDAMGGGGTIRDMLGTQGFVGRGNGGGGGLMAPQAPIAGSGGPAATRPGQPPAGGNPLPQGPGAGARGGFVPPNRLPFGSGSNFTRSLPWQVR